MLHRCNISTSSADNDDNDDDIFIFFFGTKASAAAKAVLDRDAFPGKPFFLVHNHWTHQQMLSSFRVPPDLRPAGFEHR